MSRRRGPRCRERRGWLAAVAFLLLAPAATAVHAGRLSGRVVDVAGEPLAHARLTLRGEALPGDRTRRSGPDGRFRYVELPAGSYELRAERDGYITLEQTGIRVRVEREVHLTLELLEAFDGDEVMLAGWAPGLDVTSTFGGAGFGRDLLARLPAERTYVGTVLLAPDVIPGPPGGLPAAGGASAVESRYHLDGLDTTHPVFGTPGIRLPLELVDELDVRTGGAPAAHAGAPGAVVDVVTRRGGDEHRGELFAHYTGEEVAASRPAGFADVDGGLLLGGAVLPARLWYLGGVDRRERDVAVSPPPPGGAAGERRTVYYTARLTGRAGTEHDLEITASGDPTTLEGGGGAEREAGGERLSASWHGPLAGPVRARLLAGSHEQRLGDGEEASRDELRGSLTASLGSGRLVHEIAAGGRREEREARSAALSPRPGMVAAARAEEEGAFVEERLRLPALAVSVGVRADSLRATSSLGDRAGGGLTFGLEDRIAPRLGLAWDVWGFNRSRLYAHHGRYYEIVPLALPLTGLAAGLEVDQGLEATFVRETRVGFAMEPLPDLTVGISAVRRRTEEVIEDVLPAAGAPARLTNPPGVRRRHEAVELYLARRFSGGWQLATRYVYADSEGSWEGPLALPGTDPAVAHRTVRFDLPGLTGGGTGALPADRRHRFTAYGSRRWAGRLTTGAVLSVRSGAPVSRLGGDPVAGRRSRFVSRRGAAGRTPDLWRLDVRLARPWEWGPVRLTLSADLLNLTNERDAVRVDEEWTAGAGDERTNPSFGEPVERQEPRTLRLGVELEW